MFPHITYCLCVWGKATKGQLVKIQKLINLAARIVTGLKKHDHITQALNSLGWPKIETLVARRDAVKVFKALREEGAPPELRAMFTPRAAVSTRGTHASERWPPPAQVQTDRLSEGFFVSGCSCLEPPATTSLCRPFIGWF